VQERFAIYHRPTDTWSTYNRPSRFGFLKKGESFPKLYESQRGCQVALTNFVNYCEKYFRHDLEFCLGLEIVKVVPTFEIKEVCYRQIFFTDKM
jgi:hypothetical protein